VSDQPYVVILTGDVDYSRKDELDGIAEQVEASSARDVRVEMGDVTFLDSSGISFLLRLRNATEARGGEVELHEPSQWVLKLVRLVNLDGRFHIVGGPPEDAPPD
jgi:anti-sigma B factor antagonist